MHEHHSLEHQHHTEPKSTPKEYAKFALVILGIFLLAYIIAINFGGLSLGNYLRMFMGSFFLAFGLFKLLDLKGFAVSYMGYDIIARRLSWYGYLYPFIELALALGYFTNWLFTDWFTLILMAIGSIGVFKELLRGSKIKCACLGTYIKLPLTTVSLVEDVVMGLMALLMILNIL